MAAPAFTLLFLLHFPHDDILAFTAKSIRVLMNNQDLFVFPASFTVWCPNRKVRCLIIFRQRITTFLLCEKLLKPPSILCIAFGLSGIYRHKKAHGCALLVL